AHAGSPAQGQARRLPASLALSARRHPCLSLFTRCDSPRNVRGTAENSQREPTRASGNTAGHGTGSPRSPTAATLPIYVRNVVGSSPITSTNVGPGQRLVRAQALRTKR